MIRLPRDPKRIAAEQALAQILEHLADAMEAGAGELRIRLDENYSHRPKPGLSDGIALQVEFGVAYCALIPYYDSITSTRARVINPARVFREAAEFAERIAENSQLSWELLATQCRKSAEAEHGDSQ